jgi:hypothetical protein
MVRRSWPGRGIPRRPSNARQERIERAAIQHAPVENDQADLRRVVNAGERIGVEQNEVGELPRRDRA